MTQGNIGAWKKKIGDKIMPGDVLLEIETDKATMDFECQEEGYLAKMLIPEGIKDVPVGKPLAVIAEEKKDVPAFQGFNIESEIKQVSTTEIVEEKQENSSNRKSEVSGQTPMAEESQMINSSFDGRIIASPVARVIAKNNDIDLTHIKGTGPNNRILKSDVLEALQKGPIPAKSTLSGVQKSEVVVPYQDIPLSNIRKIIAQRLSESKQSIPHYYLSTDIHMTRILNLRKRINDNANEAFKLSVNDFIVKACAMAMKDVPEVNSSWQNSFIRQYNKVDISVAVATENGLITPIVVDANFKGLREISLNIKDLAELAKKGKLRPEQFQGGTFTISNLGMFGISSFTAIINPPQSCILAVGKTEKKLIAEGNGTIGEADMMTATLSCDHRVVDGATGARWLQHVKKYLEEPAEMLV
jgi:pyruvate dehydrogenase E2 component (dihydrolipoamide acetyltransferase)